MRLVRRTEQPKMGHRVATVALRGGTVPAFESCSGGTEATQMLGRTKLPHHQGARTCLHGAHLDEQRGHHKLLGCKNPTKRPLLPFVMVLQVQQEAPCGQSCLGTPEQSGPHARNITLALARFAMLRYLLGTATVPAQESGEESGQYEHARVADKQLQPAPMQACRESIPKDALLG